MDKEEQVAFYERHYDLIGQWFLRPGTKVVLDDARNSLCRFCGRGEPEVTFGKVAHAIPEALGNKSLTSRYECDACNDAFGKGIENDLGNWSKPMRTFARIVGKKGVPTLAKGGPGQWRIEYNPATGFDIKDYENDPIVEVDEAARKVTLKLRRDTHVPIAVYKAFVKIGLTLLPHAEMANFRQALAWIRDADHQAGPKISTPIIYTLQPGPMPNDLIAAFVLRRKASVTAVPYAFLVLAYGNEVFQVWLPSPEKEAELQNQSAIILPFPVPGHPDQTKYGQTRTGRLDMTGTQPVAGGMVTLTCRADLIVGGPVQAPNAGGTP